MCLFVFWGRGQVLAWRLRCYSVSRPGKPWPGVRHWLSCWFALCSLGSWQGLGSLLPPLVGVTCAAPHHLFPGPWVRLLHRTARPPKGA